MPIVSRIDLHENEEGHEDDEKKLDDRWNKKMSRAMTMISVVEDDHPCWAKVDAVWSEYGLTKDQKLSTEQAKDYVMKYAKQELGMTTKVVASSEELLKDIFNDIDVDKDGQFSRDEMFEHLKKNRELEFERQSDASLVD